MTDPIQKALRRLISSKLFWILALATFSWAQIQNKPDLVFVTATNPPGKELPFNPPLVDQANWRMVILDDKREPVYLQSLDGKYKIGPLYVQPGVKWEKIK